MRTLKGRGKIVGGTPGTPMSTPLLLEHRLGWGLGGRGSVVFGARTSTARVGAQVNMEVPVQKPPGPAPEDSTLGSAQDLERTQKRVGVFRSET